MPEPGRRPRRFRRRLTAAFVLVAAVSAGVLALVTYGIATNNRWRSLDQSSRAQANVALALAPATLDDTTFDRYVKASELRAGVETLAITPGREYSTSSAITSDMVPPSVLTDSAAATAGTDATVNGVNYRLYSGTASSGVRYAFLFPLDQVQTSLDELRTILVAVWATVVLGAMAVGALVARQTLRPVRAAADAARAIAGGELGTRLPAEGDDEFSAWAASFNQMADALEARIHDLANAAERERQFTADAAHDLRTPLTALSVTASMLRERLDELPDDLQPMAEMHERDVERLRALVLELLELYRLDAGREELRIETLDVARSVGAILDGLHLPAGVPAQVDIPQGTVVQAERARLRRIVSNLVANAMAHGGGNLVIRAHDEGSMVAIEVEDGGPGIADADLEHVFDRFFKSDSSRARGGSGLGLAIAREHARIQGGDLSAHNLPGGGACFTLTLPRGLRDARDRAGARSLTLP